MKNILILIFLLTVTNYCLGQETFFKTIDTPYCNRSNTLIETSKGEFIITLKEDYFLDNQTHGSIYKFSKHGELINWKCFNGPNGGSSDFIIEYGSDNESYMIGGTIDSIFQDTRYNALYIEQIDDDLDIIQRFIYPYTKDTCSIIQRIEMKEDSLVYLLINRYLYSRSYFDFYIQKINLNTGLTSEFKPNINNSVAYDLTHNNTTNTLSIFYSGQLYNKEASFAKIINLDEDLAFINADTLVSDMDNYPNAQLINANNYILVSKGFSEYSPYNYCHSIYVYKMNIQNDTIKGAVYYPEHPQDSLLYTFINSNLAISNSTIAVGGIFNIEPFQYPYRQTEATYIQLSFFDYDINMQKQLYYGNGVDVYWPISIQPTMDGGFVICGAWRKPEITNPPNQDLFILKVNSEGLITGLEEPKGICASEALVYPNPGGEQFQVKLAAQHQNALLEMYSLNGKMLLSEQLNQAQTTINAQALPQGCYTYRITSNGQKIANGKWVKE